MASWSSSCGENDVPVRKRMATNKNKMKIDIVDHFRASVSSRSSFKALRIIKQKLSKPALDLFRGWCFGHFLDLQKVHCSGQLIQQLLLRLSAVSDKALWFDVGGSELRFSMKEFAIITGLNCDEYRKPNITCVDGGKDGRRVIDIYLGGRKRCSSRNLDRIFCAAEARDDESMARFAMLYFLDRCLMGKEPRNCCPEEHFLMVDNMKEFNRYPWGRLCFEATIGSMKDVMSRRIERIKSGRKIKSDTYTLLGFPYALQIWGYEVIRGLAVEFGMKVAQNRFPRILNWKTPGQIKETELLAVFRVDLGSCKRLIPDLLGESGADYLRYFAGERWRSLYGDDLDGNQLFLVVSESHDDEDIPVCSPSETSCKSMPDDPHTAGISQEMVMAGRASILPFSRVYHRRRDSRLPADKGKSGQDADLSASVEQLHKKVDQLLLKQEKIDQMLVMMEKVEGMSVMHNKLDQILELMQEFSSRRAPGNDARDGVDVGRHVEFQDVRTATPDAERVLDVRQHDEVENVEAAVLDFEDEFDLGEHDDVKTEVTSAIPIVPQAIEKASFVESAHMYMSPEVKGLDVCGIKRKRMPSKYWRTPFTDPSMKLFRGFDIPPPE